MDGETKQWVLGLPDDPTERDRIVGQVKEVESDIETYDRTTNLGPTIKGYTEEGKMLALLAGAEEAIPDKS